MGIGKMNIQVKFFAQLREQLSCDELTLSMESNVASVSVNDVKNQLSQKGDIWQKYLENGKALMAVNHEIVDGACAVKSGDEVAFFPPVTGG